MTSPSETPDGATGTAPAPHLLCDVQALAGELPAPAGAMWRLAESGRQLDANVVHLPPGGHVADHREPDLDVLLLVVAGSGTLGTPDGADQALTAGALLWLPHGSTRRIDAGPEGLSYLTVHRRRPGLRIGRRVPDGAPGSAARTPPASGKTT
ncbi:cupin domain-containing protein [Actinacidiphila acidipaludis]|uniref:Cupin domain-containing protein n=1 Tax=Actinacidiphila acidipaludis TaxID=2873382 RepID=A0ABS7QFP7_9ACTN|nr:cupin domain-containing protein [Streptomyces acidipaludis]MBY8881983.1 cupin domain-containing protein [Streptomyces acidipaludis]